MIYLDNAATTLHKPDCVKEAVVEAFDTLGNANRGATDQSIKTGQVILQARQNINQLINGTSFTQVAFSQNATESLNTAIYGLLSVDDHVITTSMEHNSVLRPLYDLEQQGMDLSIIEADKLGNIQFSDIEAAIQPNTKAIIMTYESNVTGNISPIAEVSQIAKAHELLFIVDGAQAVGALPVDVQDLGIDVLCFTGHKSLLGPQGTGGLYVREGLAISPLKVGGSGTNSYQHTHPSDMPTALESGTMNGHGIAGLHASTNFLLDVGIDTVRQHELTLMKHFYEGVKDFEHVTVYGDWTDWDKRGAILSLNIGDIDSSVIADELLEDYDINTRSGAHCAPLMHQSLGTDKQGVVRFSVSYFTTISEIDDTLTAIAELVDRHYPEN